jgi:tRNA threonylcarbamoyladenosine biosynthesis protein TsaB
MLLAVDTSTPQIGLALYDGAQVLAESLWTSKARHTVELAPAVAEMLAHTSAKIEDVEALAVAIGPGSFTSLRVGLSFIKGLAFARTLPAVGINTLEVVAASQPASRLPLACLLPAGRGRLALGWFRAKNNLWQAAGEPVIITAEALAASVERDSVICGDLTAAERHTLAKNEHIRLVSPALSVRRPAILAELAYTRWQSGRVDDISTLAPLYLHIAEPIPA